MATVEQPAPQTVPALGPLPSTQVPVAPSSSPPAGDQHLVLENISWQTYEELRSNEANWRVRMTYERGTLEMMTPSPRHERLSIFLHHLVFVSAEELNLPIASLRSTTWKRPDLAAGLEPDDCFYIQNEAVVRGRDEIDLAVDPPPDLAIEIEVSRSADSKMSIYAALGVPEVWRYDGTHLGVYRLAADRQYVKEPGSNLFPTLPVEGLERAMDQRNDTDLISWTRAYRAWLRELIAKPHG